MDKSYNAPKGQMFPTLVIFAFVVVFLYALFLAFQHFNLNRSIARIEGEKIELEQRVEALQSQQIQEIANAEELSEYLDARDVKWSQVVRKFQKLVPITVFFSSYSAANDGAITVSGLGEDYASVADVIEALDESPEFVEAFVPSATLGTTGEGEDVVSFSLSVKTP